jgi:restriction endonuclease
MKLHFEPNLDFQHDAIEAVCDLFRGQETCRTEFTVTSDIGLQLRLSGMENELGIGNRLQLLDDEGLVQDCITTIADAPPITKTRLVWRKADLTIGRSGIDATETTPRKRRPRPRSCATRATSNCPTC